MRDYVNVPCPNCGGILDVLLVPACRLLGTKDSQGNDRAWVSFEAQVVTHRCRP